MGNGDEKATSVGIWDAILLGTSRRQDETHHRIFPPSRSGSRDSYPQPPTVIG